ncbi:PH domain-containing protein [Sphingomonas prati]|uniref:Putative membrane protein n=1 Tax=Sphingomonas prati TaxID=1843237 RepID=A0A7W9BS49_9SPHN|nr:PH domain-containing protein [Sphingomonas prati]MBB5729090.1 putative membrane protein [Sphingomonas prati]GGE85203.1 membrane protein [Sphingomonas prati]
MTPDAPPATPRRLDPRSVALMAVRKLPSMVFGIPLIATMSATGRVWLVVLALAAAIVSLGALWLRWRSFTYAIGADDITITQGILTTNRRSIPLDRIQDVSIERRPLARLFGVATVRLETGAGETDEGVLDAVSLAEAERIRALIRSPRTATATPDIAQPAPERTIFAMDARRLAQMGAFGFSLVWLAAIGAAVQALGNFFDYDRDQIERTIGAAPDIAAHWMSLLTVAATLLAVLIAGVIAGFVRTVLTQYGFRLTLADGRFRRIRGLLTRTEVVVGIARIQLALVERGIVSGRLGWASLRFQTLGGSNDAGGRQDMAPFARPPEIAAIVTAAGLPAFDPQPLRPVAPGHVLRSALTHAGLPLVAILAAGIVFPPALFGLLLLPIPVGAALLARRHHRYVLVGDSLQVAHGVLAQCEWTVPRDAVQAVTLSRTWLQRRLDLVTVRVDTAGARGLHRPDVVDIAPAAAARLAADLIVTKMKWETERDSDVASVHAPLTEPTDERTFS